MLKQVALILTTVIHRFKHLIRVCTFCLYSCLCSFIVIFIVFIVVVESSSSVIVRSLCLSKCGKE